ncbi:MFS transporter [Komagataeibacter swingsii]|uniref:Major facilitator superfamily (MFS) profile domain-containing protein n=1 Tax=Komagataeibacter swingsii TaxID=215220 RepID=A0A2V4QZT1_9PROT|nr:MFS transporter [Komagataeibacter swingsii]PYD69027.1 hypothetical protein CFR76_12145 [Komagataeibacter swingsii]GBQ56933.1 major facilitator superfamily transporter [Komagataeibacter swingsii DSM 16373]
MMNQGNRSAAFSKIYLLVLLVGVNMINYSDRTLVAVLTQPMKMDLHLTDTQLGAMSGVAFAAMFSLAGLVLAQWADRFSQKWVLCGAIGIWSAMCMLTANARSFAQLFAIRLGLGVGESAAAPTSYALIHTTFSPRWRPLAYGLFLTGGTLGIAFGVSIGARLGELLGWRQAMAILAAPGFLIALLIATTVRDSSNDMARNHSSRISTWATFRTIGRSPILVALVGAQSVTGIAYAGFAQWTPAFYMRTHGMTLHELSVSYAMSSTAGALIGLIVGGPLVGHLQTRRESAALMLCGGLNILSACASMAAFLVADRNLSLAMFALFGATTGSTYAPTVATFQQYAPPHARAVSAAIMMLFVINMGQGGGPFLIGALSDYLTQRNVSNALGYASLIGSAALFLSCTFYAFAASCIRAKRSGDCNSIPYPIIDPVRMAQTDKNTFQQRS